MENRQENTPDKEEGKKNAAELLENLLTAVNANTRVGEELMAQLSCTVTADYILDQKIKTLRSIADGFPREIEVGIKEEHHRQIEKINKHLYALKVLYYLSIGVLVFGIINILLLQSLGRSWYEESVKTKKEVVAEIEQEGNVIVSRSTYIELKRNTEMMQHFIKANPKDSAPLLIFQKGYDSSGKTSE